MGNSIATRPARAISAARLDTLEVVDFVAKCAPDFNKDSYSP